MRSSKHTLTTFVSVVGGNSGTFCVQTHTTELETSGYMRFYSHHELQGRHFHQVLIDLQRKSQRKVVAPQSTEKRVQLPEDHFVRDSERKLQKLETESGA